MNDVRQSGRRQLLSMSALSAEDFSPNARSARVDRRGNLARRSDLTASARRSRRRSAGTETRKRRRPVLALLRCRRPWERSHRSSLHYERTIRHSDDRFRLDIDWSFTAWSIDRSR